MGTASDKATYKLYSALAAAKERVLFGGRLGTYRYLDMHQAIRATMKAVEK
ncbi:MAG: hypothetical protein ACLQFT_14200 [Steroidobacteraceae bacterium]